MNKYRQFLLKKEILITIEYLSYVFLISVGICIYKTTISLQARYLYINKYLKY